MLGAVQSAAMPSRLSGAVHRTAHSVHGLETHGLGPTRPPQSLTPVAERRVRRGFFKVDGVMKKLRVNKVPSKSTVIIAELGTTQVRHCSTPCFGGRAPRRRSPARRRRARARIWTQGGSTDLTEHYRTLTYALRSYLRPFSVSLFLALFDVATRPKPGGLRTYDGPPG